MCVCDVATRRPPSNPMSSGHADEAVAAASSSTPDRLCVVGEEEEEEVNVANLDEGCFSFERVLSIPTVVQDCAFVWESEFDLCMRITSLSVGLDVCVSSHTMLLALFSRAADVHSMQCQQTRTEKVHAVYMARLMYHALNHAAQRAADVRMYVSYARNEVRNVSALNKAAKRALHEIHAADPTGDQRNTIRWKNRYVRPCMCLCMCMCMWI